MSQISIVIPDGSMEESVKNLFTKAGLSIIIEKKRKKQGKVDVSWIKYIGIQRPQEIPQYLANGHFDVAIVGEDWIANWGYDFPILLKLPIGRAGKKPIRIVLAVRKESNIKAIEDLPAKCEIATEYVQLAKRFFSDKERPDIRVVPSYGNTEHKIEFGATAIVDVTESGDSLRENGLEIIYEIMESSTVIVANPESLADKNKRPFIDCFVQLINGAYQSSIHAMIVANVPERALNEAIQIIGGLKGPTISPLAVEGWFALQSIVLRGNEYKIIFDLLRIGVTDIIVNREISLVMSQPEGVRNGTHFS